MAKQLNVDMRFTADTSKAKQQIAELQTAIQKLGYGSVPKDMINPAQFEQASAAARELAYHLNNAYNTKTGNLDLSKLNASLKQAGTSLPQLTAGFKNAGQVGQQAFVSLAKAIASADQPSITLNTHLSTMFTTLKNVARFQISSSIMHGLIGGVQQAYGYAQNLNQSLNNIRIVTGQSTDQMARFAEQANKTARSLSASTLDYTDAALIYYQQGLSDEDVKARTDVTVKLANISHQTAEEVSSQMTAIWNNFDDGSRSMEYFADVITALGATTASSSEEIARGLSQFAPIAGTIGLSYDKAASAMAAIIANTRQSAETVGTGLRTIFSRFESLKLGETLEDGVDLNKYTKAMQTIGVNVLDANGKLRDMDSILDDVAANWAKLDNTQKTAFATTVGGVRQYTNLMALFENWDDVQTNLLTASGAEGTLQKQADIYAESWEAARDRVKTAAQGIYKALIDEDFFISIDKTIEHLLVGVKSFIDGFGGIKNIMVSVLSFVLSMTANKIGPAMQKVIQDIQIMTGGASKVYSKMQDEFNTAVKNELASGKYSTTGEAELKSSQQLLLAKTKLGMANDKLSASEKMRAQLAIEGFELEAAEIKKLGQTVDELTQKQIEAAEKVTQAEEKKNLAQQAKNNAATGIRNSARGDITKTLDLSVFGEAIDVAAQKVKSLREKITEAFLKSDQSAVTFGKRFSSIFAELGSGATEANLEQKKQAILSLQNTFSDLFKTVEGGPKSINAIFSALKGSSSVEEFNENLNKLTSKLSTAKVPAEKLGAALKSLGISDSAIKKYIKALEELQSAEENVKKAQDGDAEAAKKLAEAREKVKNATEQLKKHTDSFKPIHEVVASEAIAKAAAGLGQVSMAINAIGSLINTWNNQDLTFGEKITASLMSLSMLIPAITGAFGALGTVISYVNGVTITNTIATFANTAAMDENAAKAAREAALKKLVASGLNEETAAAILDTVAEKELAKSTDKVAIAKALEAKGVDENTAKKVAETIATANSTAAEEANTKSILANIAARAKKMAQWIAMHPLLAAIIAGITALIAVLTIYSRHQKAKAEADLKEAEAAAEAVKKANEEADANRELLKTYNETKKAYEEGIASKEELKKAAEDVTAAYKIENAELLMAAGAYEEIAKKAKEAAKAEADAAKKAAERAFSSAESAFRDTAGKNESGYYWAGIGATYQDYTVGLGNGTAGTQTYGKQADGTVGDEYYMFKAAESLQKTGAINSDLLTITEQSGDMLFAAQKNAAGFLETYEAMMAITDEARKMAAEDETFDITNSETYNAAMHYIEKMSEPYERLKQAEDLLINTSLDSLVADIKTEDVTTLEDYTAAIEQMKATLMDNENITNRFTPEEIAQMADDYAAALWPELQDRKQAMEKIVLQDQEDFVTWLDSLSDEERKVVYSLIFTANGQEVSLEQVQDLLAGAQDQVQATKRQAKIEELGTTAKAMIAKEGSKDALSMQDLVDFYNENQENFDWEAQGITSLADFLLITPEQRANIITSFKSTLELEEQAYQESLLRQQAETDKIQIENKKEDIDELQTQLQTNKNEQNLAFVESTGAKQSFDYWDAAIAERQAEIDATQARIDAIDEKASQIVLGNSTLSDLGSWIRNTNSDIEDYDTIIATSNEELQNQNNLLEEQKKIVGELTTARDEASDAYWKAVDTKSRFERQEDVLDQFHMFENTGYYAKEYAAQLKDNQQDSINGISIDKVMEYATYDTEDLTKYIQDISTAKRGKKKQEFEALKELFGDNIEDIIAGVTETTSIWNEGYNGYLEQIKSDFLKEQLGEDWEVVTGTTLEELSADLEQKTQEYLDAKANLEAAEGKQAEIQGKIDQITSDRDQAEADKAAAIATRDEMQSEYDRISEEIAEKQAELEGLEEYGEKEKLLADIETLEAEKKEAEEKRDEENRKLEEAEQKLRDLEDEEKSLSSELLTAESELAALEAQATESQANLERYEEAKQQLEWIQEFMNELSDINLDSSEVDKYAKQLKLLGEYADLDDKILLEMSKDQLRWNRAVASANSNMSKWEESLKEFEKGEGYLPDPKTIDEIGEAFADILDIDASNLSTSFKMSSENLTLMKEALDGNTESYQKLQQLAREELITTSMTNMGYDEEAINQVVTGINNISDAIAELPEGVDLGEATIDGTPALDALTDIVNAAGLTAEQATSLLSSMGIDAEVVTDTEHQVVRGQYEGATGEITYKQGTVKLPVDAEGNTEEVPFSIPSIEYKDAPVPTETDIAGGGFALKVISANKSSGGGIKNRRTGGGSSKGGGGGGGGGKSKNKDTVKADKGTRYHAIRARQSNNSNKQAETNRQKERAFGKEKIAQAEKEIKLQKEQVSLQKEYLDEIQKYLKQDKEDMIKAWGDLKLGFNLDIDSDGVIKNYQQVEDALLKAENDLVDKYNKGLLDDEQFEKEKKKIDEYKELMNQYEETQDLLEDEMNNLQEQIDSVTDSMIELASLKLELNISMSEDDLKLINYYLEKLEDNAYDAAEAIGLLGQQAEQYLAQSEFYKNAINDLLKIHLSDNEIEKFNNGLLTTQDLLDKGFTEKDIEKIRDWSSSLLDANKSLEEAQKTVEEKFMTSLDSLNEEVEESKARFDELTSIVQHYQNIIDIVGKDNLGIADSTLALLRGTTVDAAIAELNVAKHQLDSFKAIRQDIIDRLESGELDEASQKYWEEQQKEVEKELNQAQEDFMTSFEDAVQGIFDSYAATLDDAINKFLSESGLSDTISGLKDYIQDSNDNNVSNVTKTYELTKLTRDIQKSIDDTPSIKGKQKLLDLQNKINDAMADGKEYSQEQLNILRKEYELAQAQMALEDIEQAKQSVRMSRDNEGNWSYVYVADEDKIADAEQELDDKLYEYNQAVEEYYQALIDRSEQMTNDYAETYKQIALDMTISDEERQEKLALLQEQYKANLDDLNEKQSWMVEQADVLNQQEYQDRAAAINIITQGDQHLQDVFANTAWAQAANLESMEETLNAFSENSKMMLDISAKAYEDYQEANERAFEAAGYSIEQFTENGVQNSNYFAEMIVSDAEDIKEQISTTEDLATGLADNMKTMMGSVADFISEWKDKYSSAVSEIVTFNENLVKSCNDLIKKLKDTQQAQIDAGGGADVGGTEGGGSTRNYIETVNSGSGSKNSGNNSGGNGGCNNGCTSYCGGCSAVCMTACKGSTAQGCFAPGTQILMSNLQTKNIEEVQIGDLVIAYNPNTEQFDIQKVNKTFINPDTTELVYIYLNNNKVLHITPGHPILTPEGWKSLDLEGSLKEHGVEATLLQFNDKIITYDGLVEVKNIEYHFIPEGYQTYNIEVNKDHTFLAENAIVHNKGGCFAPGTQITMADFTTKNIEDIKVGDFVLAYNEINKTFESKRVAYSFAHYNTTEMLDIYLSNGTILQATACHPILTTEGWKSLNYEIALFEHEIETSPLKIGQKVICQNDENIFITNIIWKKDIPHFTTYNITVEDIHTYIANGIIVHNMSMYATDLKFKSGGYTGTWPASGLTGMYTGSWNGPDIEENGKLAFLHQKELVLNASDTENMLDAVKIIRDISRTIDLQAMVTSQGLSSLLPGSVSLGTNTLDQNVHIDATFPNVTDHNEIEEAFHNLIGKASQFAQRNKI